MVISASCDRQSLRLNILVNKLIPLQLHLLLEFARLPKDDLQIGATSLVPCTLLDQVLAVAAVLLKRTHAFLPTIESNGKVRLKWLKRILHVPHQVANQFANLNVQAPSVEHLRLEVLIVTLCVVVHPRDRFSYELTAATSCPHSDPLDF